MRANIEKAWHKVWLPAVLLLACAAPPLIHGGANASPRLKDGPSGVATKTRSRLDAARFRARVDAALADAHARKVFWGILVADRDTGEVLYDLNSDHFFMPASNAKII
ncbi:MAG TPA: D-alanyl-D-alanine carboxypeptidase, partial [Candidatus Acidoferrales bacterium]|nr:D-alanyl-D-alanine carboxypeptidase [Candidatus Acidoferrales bacterium]